MEYKKLKLALLISTCGVTLSCSAVYADGAEREENETFSGHLYHVVSRSIAPLKDYMRCKVDNQTEKVVNSISKEAARFASSKIRDLFFLDKDRYGVVEGTGQRVNIYMNKSQALNSIFSKVFGCSIDDVINGLPIGFKQSAGLFRNKIEEVIFSTFIEHLSSLSVEKVTHYTLLKAYGYGKGKLQNMVMPFTDSEYLEDHDEKSLKDILNKFKAEQSKQPRNQVLGDDDLDENCDGITFKNVLDGFKIRLLEYMNEKFKDILTESISQASRKVTENGVGAILNQVKKASTLSGIVANCLFGPGGSLTLMGTGLIVHYTETDIKDNLGEKAYNWVQKMIRAKLDPKIVSIDYSKAGRMESESLMDSMIGWEKLTYTPYNIENWAKSKVERVKDAVSPAANYLQAQYNIAYDPSDVMSNIKWRKDYERPDNPYILSPDEDPKLPYVSMSNDEFDNMNDQESERYQDLLDKHEEELKKDRNMRLQVAKEAAKLGEKKIQEELPKPKTFFERIKGWFSY